MKIASRLERIEQTVDARLRALMPSDDALTERGLIVRRMLEYVGLPGSEWNKSMADRRQTQIRIAQIMLSTGCNRRSAIARHYAESHDLTEDGAHDWLRQLAETGRAAQRDLDAGTPFSESEAGARLRVMLDFGPKARGET